MESRGHFGGPRDVFELKLASSPRALQRGLEQVTAYARRLGRDRGYLILFDPSSERAWEERGQIQEQEHEGITVVVVWA